MPPAAAAESVQHSLSGRPKSVPVLGFRAPEEEPIPSPAGTIPSPASSPEEELLGPASAHDYDEASDPSESPAGTSSRGSTPGGEKVGNPLAGEGLRSTFRAGVIIASDQTHRFLARTQGQLETRLYLADDQDAANIGDPLASLVARREGLGEVSPDTADLLSALMGLAGYATKQIQKQAVAKQIDARAAAGDVQHLPTPEDLA